MTLHYMGLRQYLEKMLTTILMSVLRRSSTSPQSSSDGYYSDGRLGQEKAGKIKDRESTASPALTLKRTLVRASAPDPAVAIRRSYPGIHLLGKEAQKITYTSYRLRMDNWSRFLPYTPACWWILGIRKHGACILRRLWLRSPEPSMG